MGRACNCTDAMAIGMGFEMQRKMLDNLQDVSARLKSEDALTPRDWSPKTCRGPRRTATPGLRRRPPRIWHCPGASCSISSLVTVSSKSERRAAREAVAAYHEGQLAALVERVGEAVDRFRNGDLDAFEADQAVFQYSRAAKELWKFCNVPNVEFTARMIIDRAPADWWDRGTPRQNG
jgi:hypothetical protein